MSITIPFDKFEETFEKLVANQTKAVFVITSEKNADGSYWCPDCEAIKPLYPRIEAESKKANLPFYVFIAGDRPTWKDPNNKFRKNKLILINSVPTMGLFDGKKLVRKLVEN